MEILVKDIKSTVFNILNKLKEIIDKELKETTRTMYEQIGNGNKEIKIIKWNKIETLEPKNTINKK